MLREHGLRVNAKFSHETNTFRPESVLNAVDNASWHLGDAIFQNRYYEKSEDFPEFESF